MANSLAYGIAPGVSYFDSNKLPLAGGTIASYDNNTRLPKDIFQDPTGFNAYPNPAPLDSAGRISNEVGVSGPTYFQEDAPYYFEYYDVNGALAATYSNVIFTSGGGSGPITISNDINNLMINGQLRFFEQNSYAPITKDAAFLIAPDQYYFFADGVNGTDSLSFLRFNLDDTNVDANPIYYLKYVSEEPGTGQSAIYLEYRINDVRSLAGVECTFSFAGISFIGETEVVEFQTYQYFGAGGSSAVLTPITTFNLTSVWGSPKSYTFTFPAVTGKTIDDSNDDYVSVRLYLPTDKICQLGFTNFYLKIGEDNAIYPFRTYDETLASLQGLDIPVGGNDDNYSALTFIQSSYNAAGSYSLLPNPPVGSTTTVFINAAPAGWVMCDGSAYPKLGVMSRLYTGETCSLQHHFTNTNGFSINTTGEASNAFLVCSDRVGVQTTPTSSSGSITITTVTAGTSSVRAVYRVTFVTTSNDDSHLIFYDSTGAPYLIQFVFTPPVVPFALSARLILITRTTTSQPGYRDQVITQLNAQGFQSTDNFTAIASSSTVTVNSMRIGTQANSPSNGDSPFTLTLSTPGADDTYEVVTITATGGNTVNAGDHFLISTPTKQYCFWMIVGGAGSQPTVSNVDYYVPIAIVGNESSTAVATLLVTAIDQLMYAVPDTRGLFTRIASAASVITGDLNYHVDPGASSRYQRPDGTGGNVGGSIQYEDIGPHTHTYGEATAFASSGFISHVGTVGNETKTTSASTGVQTVPNNIEKYEIIKF